MLDEVLEYEEYTSNCDKPELMPARLHKQNIKCGGRNEISGIYRPLLIIARKYLFQGDADAGVSVARDALLSWLGFKEESSELNKDIYAWFRKYLINLYPEYGDLLQKKKAEYEKEIFPINKDSEKNDINAIRYDHVLSEAKQAGKLKRYYLICDTNPVDLIKISVTKKTETKSAAKLNEGDVDSVLKLTAYYLLQRGDSNQKYAFVTMIDLCNWINVSERKTDFGKYYWNTGESILLYRKVGNRNKIALNEEWTRHFRVIEQEELSKYMEKGYFFMRDGGYSRRLLEGAGREYSD